MLPAYASSSTVQSAYRKSLAVWLLINSPQILCWITQSSAMAMVIFAATLPFDSFFIQLCYVFGVPIKSILPLPKHRLSRLLQFSHIHFLPNLLGYKLIKTARLQCPPACKIIRDLILCQKGTYKNSEIWQFLPKKGKLIGFLINYAVPQPSVASRNHYLIRYSEIACQNAQK